MNMTSEDIKDMLVAETTLELVFATNLFIGRVPTEPDDCVTIFDAGGPPSDRTLGGSRYYRDAISIQVRNNSYPTGYALAESILDYLLSKSQSTQNGVLYTSIQSESGILTDNWDDNSRNTFIINFNTQRRLVEEETFDLTTSTDGSGTIIQNPTGTTFDKDTVVTAYADADANWEFDRWEKNTNIITGNPISFVMNQDYDLVAYFTSLIMNYYQEVFTGVADVIEDSGLTYIEDQGVGGVNIQVKNMPVGALDGVGMYVISNGISNRTYLEFNILLIDYEHVPNTALLGQSTDFRFYINSSRQIICRVRDGSGSYSNKIFTNINVSSIYYEINIKMRYNESIEVNGTTISVPSMYDKFDSYTLGFATSYAFLNTKIALWEAVGIFKYNFQETKELTVYSSYVDGVSGRMSGGLVSYFRGSTSDYASSDLREYGYEIYEDNSNPGEYLYVIFANGIPQTPTISGYTKVREVQPYAFDQNPYGYLNENDTTLNAAYDTYAQLGVLKNPNVWTYDDVIGISLVGIDPDVFVYTKTGDVVSGMKTAKQ